MKENKKNGESGVGKKYRDLSQRDTSFILRDTSERAVVRPRRHSSHSPLVGDPDGKINNNYMVLIMAFSVGRKSKKGRSLAAIAAWAFGAEYYYERSGCVRCYCFEGRGATALGCGRKQQIMAFN